MINTCYIPEAVLMKFNAYLFLHPIKQREAHSLKKFQYPVQALLKLGNVVAVVQCPSDETWGKR